MHVNLANELAVSELDITHVKASADLSPEFDGSSFSSSKRRCLR